MDTVRAGAATGDDRPVTEPTKGGVMILPLLRYARGGADGPGREEVCEDDSGHRLWANPQHVALLERDDVLWHVHCPACGIQHYGADFVNGLLEAGREGVDYVNGSSGMLSEAPSDN